jgi:hypothetical protein
LGTTLINNIITKYTAQKRDADYVGYTCRHLHQRIDEHKSSVVGEHMVEQHGEDAKNCTGKNFKVLRKCRGKFECFLHEMLFIKDLKPSLNKQSDTFRKTYLIELAFSSTQSRGYGCFPCPHLFPTFHSPHFLRLFSLYCKANLFFEPCSCSLLTDAIIRAMAHVYQGPS